MTDKYLTQRRVLQLAIPMIISNISTPLLGLVDTAVMGHLQTPSFLAAVALSGLIFNFLYWGFGFLRMGTTGMTAQAFGARKVTEIKAILLRACFIAGCIGALFVLLQTVLAKMAFALLQSNEAVELLALQYFYIRIWSAPAVLGVYVLTGWFLGMQNVKAPLVVVLVSNISNIVLDIALVYYLKMDITGVALASAIAEYLGLFTGLLILQRHWRHLTAQVCVARIVNFARLRAMLAVNSNIFIRTWCLIFAFAFFTAQGARLGEVVLAANAVLLNFQTFMAYALDGFAHAAEALVGRAVGEKNVRSLRKSVKIAGFWSLVIACGFTVSYGLFGGFIVDMLTDLLQVRSVAYQHLPWVALMPMVAFTCYLFDGVFIGAMLTKQMRDSMLFSLFICYLPSWYFSQPWGNTGLWLSMTIFMLGRGLSMSFLYGINMRRGRIVS